MDKKKFTIPLPDEHIIQSQIERIVSSGITQKKTFSAYLKSMVQQVGIRQLFSDRLELGFILFSALALLISFLVVQGPIQTERLYAYIFLASPILFLAFAIHTYINKIQNTTYELEMACKYNVYQVIAFRMLAFSIISIVVNTIAIAFIATIYDDIQFIRALMISITALFIFSILFLYALMKRRSTIIVATTIVGWILGNLLLRMTDNELYGDLILQLPITVYALVLISCLYVYMKYVSKLIHFKQTEGVF